MPLKIKFIKDDDEGILPYCEEEDAEKFYFQQILTARFSWGSNIFISVKNPKKVQITAEKGINILPLKMTNPYQISGNSVAFQTHLQHFI